MVAAKDIFISFVIPAYNEAEGLSNLQTSLTNIAKMGGYKYEIIYCDDGSSDNTSELVTAWNAQDENTRLVRLSRNFGKESALAAGIATAKGDAIILLDADGQHPVEKIPEFISKWQNGAQVVSGIRTSNQGEGSFKRNGSRLFYAVFNRISDQPLMQGSTDFRLISRPVADAFLDLKENDRITRGLIDWLGFRQDYVEFKANAREHGDVSYSRRKLIRLAANSFVSLTSTPMYLFGYLGVFITIFSLLLGASITIEQLILKDPLNWNFTGTAMLGVLIIFLVGIVLLSQGILSVYIAHIHNQSKQRPLYIIDYDTSAGVKKSSGK